MANYPNSQTTVTTNYAGTNTNVPPAPNPNSVLIVQGAPNNTSPSGLLALLQMIEATNPGTAGGYAGFQIQTANGQTFQLDGNISAIATTAPFTQTIALGGGNETETGVGATSPLNIIAGTGPDSIVGGGGSNTITGGNNVDTLYGGSGPNLIFGGNGNLIFGGSGPNTIYGGADDHITGGTGPTTVYGGEGDTIQGFTGNMTVYSGPGDEIVTGAGSDTVFGATGDTIIGGSGYSTIHAEAGGELVGGAGLGCIFFGGVGDTIVGGAGPDLIFANAGEQLVTGGKGSDTIVGGVGDTIAAGASTNQIYLGPQPEHLDQTAGGSSTVSGWEAGDKISFSGQSAATISTVVASQKQDAQGNAVITLPDGSTITLIGIAHVTANFFG